MTQLDYESKISALVDKHGEELVKYSLWNHTSWPFNTIENTIKELEKHLTKKTMTDNTELFDRILAENLDEVVKEYDGYANWDDFKNGTFHKDLVEDFLREASILAMQELSEFKDWVRDGERVGRYERISNDVYFHRYENRVLTELELFDIWKAEKGGDG